MSGENILGSIGNGITDFLSSTSKPGTPQLLDFVPDKAQTVSNNLAKASPYAQSALDFTAGTSAGMALGFGPVAAGVLGAGLAGLNKTFGFMNNTTGHVIETALSAFGLLKGATSMLGKLDGMGGMLGIGVALVVGAALFFGLPKFMPDFASKLGLGGHAAAPTTEAPT